MQYKSQAVAMPYFIAAIGLFVGQIIFGLILMAEYGSLGSGLAMLWAAAIWGLIGGVLMIIQAFRQRKA